MSSISGLSSAVNLTDLFKKADADGDGSLSVDEFGKINKALPTNNVMGNQNLTAKQQFTNLDTNADGKLSQDELKTGVDLAQRVIDALLQAQQITNGGSLASMLDGGSNSSGGDSLASLFGSSSTSGSDIYSSLLGGTDTSGDTTGTDSLTALLQQIIAKYQQTDSAATDTTTATGTTTTQTA